MSQLHKSHRRRRNTNAALGAASYAGRETRLRWSGDGTDRGNILAFRPLSRKSSVSSTTRPGMTRALSIKMIEAVLDILCGSTEKLVLLVLANYANDVGDSCYPGMGTLQRQTGLSDRGIQKALRRLEQAGHLRVIHRKGTSNRFRLLTPRTTFAPPRTTFGSTPEPRSGYPSSDPSLNPLREKPLETVGERRQAEMALLGIIAGVEKYRRRGR